MFEMGDKLENKKIDCSSDILNFSLKEGFLLDKEILNSFAEVGDFELIKFFICKLQYYSKNRIINKKFFSDNKEDIYELIICSGQNSENVKKFISKFNLIKEEENKNSNKKNTSEEIKVVSINHTAGKKLEVKDFVKYFRNRFSEMRTFLQEHAELTNLVSIKNISGNKQGISIIGIVSDKIITKNKNIMLEVEDLTGKIKVLINCNKKELYEKAEEITLDSVLGFTGSGNEKIFFANEIVFPDSSIPERKFSPEEEYALFIGDLHIGSKLFLEESFLKFINFLNGKVPGTPFVEKIKYLFIAGDLVAGVGNYPNQEKDLILLDLEEHFEKAANLLGLIKKDIKIIISPGNHDGIRIMEPQPLLDERYAWPLYQMKNVIITTNPSQINIGSKENFSGFDVLAYHGFSFPYYASNIPFLIKQKAMNTPEIIMNYLLKNRHLAPTHGSMQYFPSENDVHLIRKIPDIFVSGHTHKSGICYYNNILVISVSSWEGMTSYQEKMGMVPDLCKVPMFNLKTRAVKILDFEEKGER
jgi:DNA polymerase II small subunit